MASDNVGNHVYHGAHNSSRLCVSEVGVTGSMSNYNVCLYCGRVIGYADPTMPAYCNLGCQFKAEDGPSKDWQKNFESSLIEFKERVKKRFEERNNEK